MCLLIVDFKYSKTKTGSFSKILSGYMNDQHHDHNLSFYISFSEDYYKSLFENNTVNSLSSNLTN